MGQPKFITLEFTKLSADQMEKRSRAFYIEMKRRRTVREFSTQGVPIEVIKNCLLSAGSAPSGANLQPWTFCIVTDPAIKKKIRVEAEEEERKFYEERAPEQWLKALEPLETDESKPFLETAPYLIVVFSQAYSFDSEGTKTMHYYSQESTGIATGFLIAALHNAGLATLTHTPSPMKFLNQILERPPYERPFLLLVTGFPLPNTKVPNIHKKVLEDFTRFI